jgi:hypothetical protein
MDFVRRLFEDERTLRVIIVSSVIGLIAGLAHGFVQLRYGGWRGFLAATLIAVVVANIVGLSIGEVIGSEMLKLSIIGMCAAASGDIWIGFKVLGRGLRTDPLGFVFRVLDALRGQPVRGKMPGPIQGTPTRPAPLEGEKP